MTNEFVFPEGNPETVQQATLCFLVKDGKVLLAMKKRGFGVGLWNGVGGKAKEETIEEAAARETCEEIGIEIKTLEKVALLHFYFPDDPEKKNWNQDVHVFLVKDWAGDPRETEEMQPRWFDPENLPFDHMWDDDHIWLPKILDGDKIEAWFSFDDNSKVFSNKIEQLK